MTVSYTHLDVYKRQVLNRMTGYTEGTTEASYEYNNDNMRSSKTVDGAAAEQVWVNGQIVLDKQGTDVVKYTYGSKLVESDYGWYSYDAHGNVTMLTDDTGAVIKRYDYDPYGVELGEADEADANPFRYSGQYTDRETGYVYLRARYYDPALGRFLSMDMMMDGANWYIYCAGNPVMFIDPSGLVARREGSFGSSVEYMQWMSEVSESPSSTTTASSEPETPIKVTWDDISNAIQKTWEDNKEQFKEVGKWILNAAINAVAKSMGEIAEAFVDGGGKASGLYDFKDTAFAVEQDMITHTKNVYNINTPGYEIEPFTSGVIEQGDDYKEHCKAVYDTMPTFSLYFQEYYPTAWDNLSEDQKKALKDEMVTWDKPMYIEFYNESVKAGAREAFSIIYE